MLRAELAFPQVTPGNSSGIHTGGLQPVPSHWRGPTLELGEEMGLRRREWNSFLSRSFTGVSQGPSFGLRQMAEGW